MAKLIDDVSPGALITAAYFQKIAHLLNSFDDRLAALESAGPPEDAVIIDTVSPAGAVQVNDTVSISGRNFEFTIGATQVTFNGKSVTSFLPGSSDTLL